MTNNTKGGRAFAGLTSEGMSLRQYYAAKALPAFINQIMSRYPASVENIRIAATHALQAADELIALENEGE